MAPIQGRLERIHGWGRFPEVQAELIEMRCPEDARETLARRGNLIVRGNGRSYGDPALNAKCVLSTRQSNRILAFDPVSGRVTVEAGLLLSQLIEFAVPRGFFPPVVPGTKHVTIGGMIAADIHGKNHHFAGTFSRHLDHFLLMTADGEMRSCRPGMNDDLFNATCGGMGLTGIIVEATIRLEPVASSSIRQETLRSAGLEETFALCEASADWTYTVAWIDCLKRGKNFGRGIVYRGVHASAEEGGEFRVSDRPTYRIPFDFPGCLLNSVSMQVFNELYYRRARPGQAIIDYDRFFFPLDSVADWNRSYGRKGFTQYQCVIPKSSSSSAIRTILDRVSSCGAGSFLAVLKLFGEEGAGFLSFPMEGYTLTLDFPIRIETFTLLRELDAVVIDHGGRLYLAKDARASAATLKRGYPRIDRFIAVRDRVDPRRKFTSLQSNRLGL